MKILHKCLEKLCEGPFPNQHTPYYIIMSLKENYRKTIKLKIAKQKGSIFQVLKSIKTYVSQKIIEALFF